MGTILASAIITDMRAILQDEDSDNYTWTDTLLLSFLNAAQRNIPSLKPDAYVVNSAIQLVAGMKQTLPSDAISLIKITWNMGAAGTTRGLPINHIPSLELFNFIVGPYLATTSADAVVESYSYDEDDPLNFYVYPPQPASSMGYVEEIYSAIPADIATTATAITLRDVYAGAMKLYGLYLCYLLETDTMSQARSQAYYNAYLQELGLKSQAQAKSDPKTKD
jgi:hypothetical protein